MRSYSTLVEALNDLKKRGYTTDFNLQSNCLYCGATQTSLDPKEFEITEVYRFEGMNDPSDSSILYAIESHHGMKGVLVNAYGLYADDMNSEMVAKLSKHTN
jgi:hypothetical protein